MNIAVLITTFNRKEKTLACLRKLTSQDLPQSVHLTVYLTDDASADGTAEAAAAAFPDIHVYHGTGSLFWAGGMRKSWSKAAQANPGFFLLLNDDTVLFDDTISRLLQTYNEAEKQYAKPAIIIGRTQNSKGNTSYGGRKLLSPKKINSAVFVEDNNTFAECDLGNANIMLVPRGIYEHIGNLSHQYTHGIADFDYTLRAKKKGFPVLVAPGVLGLCENDHGKSWKPAHTTLKERIRYLYSPKGLAYKEYLYFIKTHFPSHYPEILSKLWLKTVFPFLWDRLKKETPQ